MIDDRCTTITESQWDYLVLAEVLEHIDNPVRFLQAPVARYKHCVRALIITVPNAFDEGNQRFAKQHTEGINSDHRYWFTPYTLCKVAHAAGLEIDSLRTCHNGVVKRRSVLKNRRLSRYPLLRNNIMLISDLG